MSEATITEMLGMLPPQVCGVAVALRWVRGKQGEAEEGSPER